MADSGAHLWYQFIGERDALLALLSSDEYPTAMRHKIVRAQLWRLLIEHEPVEKALGRCLSVAPLDTTGQVASAMTLREEVPGDPQVAELVESAEAAFGVAHQRWLRRVLKILSEALNLIPARCQRG